MTAMFLDACKFTPTAGGTASFVVSANVAGYMTPAQVGAIDQATYHYRAESADLTQWEVGLGTYTASTGTLTRSTVLYNSLGTSAQINFSGPPAVGIVPVSGDFRVKLTSTLVLYVSTTGSDSNSGLTASSPFATIQHAINVAIGNYDSGGQGIFIQLADGTYNIPNAIAVYAPLPGGGQLYIQGNASNMGNVVLSAAANQSVLIAYSGGNVWLQWLTMQGTTGSTCLNALNNGTVQFANVNFGAFPSSAASQLYIVPTGVVKAQGPYTISGSTGWHICNSGGYVQIAGQTITLTGTPAFAQQFVLSQVGYTQLYSNTYSGSATGVRYSVTWNGVLQTNGQYTSLPGSTAGSTATGGVVQ